MNCIFKLYSHRVLCKSILLQQYQKRTIFHASFMTFDKVQKKQKEFLASCDDVKANFQAIKHNYEKGGIEVLTKNQVHNLMALALGNPECNDKELVKSVVKSFNNDLDRELKSRKEIIKSYMHFCYQNQDIKSAQEIPDHIMPLEEFQTMNMLTLMIMLYDAGLYENVHEIFKKGKDNCNSIPAYERQYTIVMAALYQLGTEEAFREAIIIKNEAMEKIKNSKKGTYLPT